MVRALWIRAVFVYLTVQSVLIGGWALVSPRSFYDDFPGGRGWVSVDGPYNEHLVRDVGALNLAIAVLFAAAVWRRTRELDVVACTAGLVWGVPHLVYHLLNTDGLGAVDVVANLGGLALFVVLPATVLVRPVGGD